MEYCCYSLDSIILESLICVTLPYVACRCSVSLEIVLITQKNSVTLLSTGVKACEITYKVLIHFTENIFNMGTDIACIKAVE